jgi:hypothetical protein
MEKPPISPELADAVAHYLGQLRAGDFESAFHGMTDLDPSIVHPLIAAYDTEAAPEIRSSLLRIIWEFRTPLALPLLAEALSDRSGMRWKMALDGLVTLASIEAIGILHNAFGQESFKPKPDSEYLACVGEALEQAREAAAD